MDCIRTLATALRNRIRCAVHVVRVITSATGQRVITRTTGQRVIASPSPDQVIARITAQSVVEGRPQQVLYAVEAIAGRRTRAECPVAKIRGEARAGRGIGRGVGAGLSDQVIYTVTTYQSIITSTAEQRIGSGAACGCRLATRLACGARRAVYRAPRIVWRSES